MTWVSQGQYRALDVLYDRYADLIYSFSFRMIGTPIRAQEIVHQVFLTVWKEPDAFQPQQESCIQWLLRMTHVRGKEELQKSKERIRLISEASSSANEAVPRKKVASSHTSAEMHAWFMTRQKRVGAALASLSTEQRRVLELAYFGGLTQEEIAEATGEPLGTVKSRIRLSLRKLREVLHPEDLKIGQL